MTQPTNWWHLIDTVGLARLDQQKRPGVQSPAVINKILAPVVANRPAAQCGAMLSLAMLWHDDLDAAHALCQEHEGDPDCDYVHALLHRREGDFSNAKYWFRAVGQHPVYRKLAATEAVVALVTRGAPLVAKGKWQPAAMVDVCETAGQTGLDYELREVQANEFAELAAYLAGC